MSKQNEDFDSRELYKNPRMNLWSPNTYVISVFILAAIVLISVPLIFESIIDWYRYIPPIILVLSLTIFLGVKIYQGVFLRHVKIFPDGEHPGYSESGYIGGKSSGYVDGFAAQVVGLFILVLEYFSIRLLLRFIKGLIEALS
jgi:hypothetical protein